MAKGDLRKAAAGAVAPRLSIGFILARRFTLSAFANFVDVLRLAADEGDRSRPILCEWTVLSTSMKPVTSSCGVAVQPQARLINPEAFDYIVVVGGLLEELEHMDAAYLGYLREAADKKVPLVGLCTGAFLLHRAGLMQGYRCCVSWFHHNDFLEQFDGLHPVSGQIFVVDRDRLTCSGGASAAHLAAFLVDRHVGRAEATKSLHIMIIDRPQFADAPQPASSLDLECDDPLVLQSLHIMLQNIDVPFTTADLARRLGTSTRRIERRFTASLGMTPMRAFRHIRLSHAKHLMLRTGKTVTTVAAEAGFCDASHFVRLFKASEGMTPETWRDSQRAKPALAEPIMA
ncbi:GlxA family transcriptional regulator [Rhodospirillaceae bacterium SYSU D60014]|uniref:GlxA family transcriptional regulator n=1 Tax=Virgifigura deserti TaxID=2268457 RepID=UPI000E6716F5